MKVRDKKTGEVFELQPFRDKQYLRTRDGAEVRVYPLSMSQMVRKGQQFDGHTTLGPRPMERIK